MRSVGIRSRCHFWSELISRGFFFSLSPLFLLFSDFRVILLPAVFRSVTGRDLAPRVHRIIDLAFMIFFFNQKFSLSLCIVVVAIFPVVKFFKCKPETEKRERRR